MMPVALTWMWYYYVTYGPYDGWYEIYDMQQMPWNEIGTYSRCTCNLCRSRR